MSFARRNEKAAFWQPFDGRDALADQAANALNRLVLRPAARLRPAKPSAIIAQVDGSGTSVTVKVPNSSTEVLVENKP